MRRLPKRPCWIALVLSSCIGTQTGPTATGTCDPRLLESGEVRVRQVPCSDELMSGGEATRGDYLLENQFVRAFFKASQALTRHRGSGGTLVDLAPPEQRDGVIELVPLVADDWFVTATIEPWQTATSAGLDVQGTLPDGSSASIHWSLNADEHTIRLSGADQLMMVPAANSTRVGSTLEARSALSDGTALIYAPTGSIEDLGGRIYWTEPDAIHVGDRAAVISARWDERVAVSGTTDGVAVVATGPDGTLTRLGVRDGTFAGEVPAETVTLRAVRGGYAPSSEQAPAEDLALPLGEPGFLVVRVEDPDGRPIPASVWWGDELWWTGTTGYPLGVGPGTRDLTISAGPRFEIAHLGSTTVTGVIEVSAVLAPAHESAALANLAIPTSPDSSTRWSSGLALSRAASRGTRFAVTVADDEVATAYRDADTARFLTAMASSRTRTADAGSVQGWPWVPTSRRPAHGAPDWIDASPEDLVALHEGGMGRFTAVDVSWLEAAGPLVEWSPRPNAVQISALSDLDILFPLLDAGLPVTLLGPHTWLAGVSPQQTTRPAAEQALWEGHTVAGNGPWIALDVLGKGPGDTLDVPWFPVSVTCAGPEWMSIQRATLWGPAGEPLAEWQADSQTPPQVTGEAFIPAQQWVIATCEGDATAWPELTSPAWAASSPLFGPL